MPSFINGFGGTFVFSAATLNVKKWELKGSGEAVDTTNVGDSGWESNILGAKSWEGSADASWDSAAVPTGAAGFLNGARGTLTLNVGGSGKSYAGTAQITEIGVGNDAKTDVTFTVSFKGSGPLTYAS